MMMVPEEMEMLAKAVCMVAYSDWSHRPLNAEFDVAAREQAPQGWMSRWFGPRRATAR